MINYVKKKLEKRKRKRTFQEYGHKIDTFQIDDIGEVEYTQWLHPSDIPKKVTKSNIDFYRRLSSEGVMIIDIGAHTGDTTVPMALAVGKTGLVLGLEPNRYVYKILEKNASLNPDSTNIIPLCLAATDKEGTFTFNYSDASFCNGGFLSQIEKKNHRHNYTLEVKGVNLEKYPLQNYADDLPRLSLIKVDAEGYDKEILKTMPGILSEYKPHLMVECYKRLNIEERNDLFDTINGFGYELYRLEDFASLNELKLVRRSNMTDEKHFEMLAVHQSKKTEVWPSL